ncbi:unnamed protein product [Rotaria sp. Silwood2]|nr:unnamed protein product [Rotaria sp. Silwood2]
MVRISSKVSHRQIQQKKQPSLQSIEINSNTNDQSSSKILNVVRQALLNAAEELVSQQQQKPQDNENQLDNTIPCHTLDINNNDLNKSPCQRNGNAIKKKKNLKKKFTCKNKKVLKNNRRK